jgi:hypothetical protein
MKCIINSSLIKLIIAGLLLIIIAITINTIYSWKTYKNTKYGFEFKYPKISNVFSYNPETTEFTFASPESHELFIYSSATEKEINSLNRELNGIWIIVSDKKINEPSNMVSKENITLNGIKTVMYKTKGMEDTDYTEFLFENKGIYYTLTAESNNTTLLKQILYSFEF